MATKEVGSWVLAVIAGVGSSNGREMLTLQVRKCTAVPLQETDLMLRMTVFYINVKLFGIHVSITPFNLFCISHRQNSECFVA